MYITIYLIYLQTYMYPSYIFDIFFKNIHILSWFDVWWCSYVVWYCQRAFYPVGCFGYHPNLGEFCFGKPTLIQEGSFMAIQNFHILVQLPMFIGCPRHFPDHVLYSHSMEWQESIHSIHITLKHTHTHTQYQALWLLESRVHFVQAPVCAT